MGLENTITGQILLTHLMEGSLKCGNEIAILIDQTLTQDATGTLVFLEFMELGLKRVKTKRSVSYVDHNTLQTSFENADDHEFLRTAAQRFGVFFSRPGNGICHQIHLERFARPGETLLGSDSHTPTCGALGMLAIGAGGMEVALAMAGVPFYMKVPKVCEVYLKGRLPKWVSAKDVILHLLKRLTVKGGVGRVMEYTGPGVKELTVYERATIANMGAELGAWTSVFPSDEVTQEFLRAQGRASDWKALSPKPGAQYSERVEIDLSSLEPLIALPHSPDNVVPVKEVVGTKVQQVAIGSCTNSSYRDLKMVSLLLKDRKIHPEVSLVISPGSRAVFLKLLEDGSIENMVRAGARILELACGPCIGMGQAPPSGGVSIRTFNRNFKGRSGTKDAMVYLSSPEVAVAAAIHGRIVEPAILGEYPEIKEPDRYVVDDTMIIAPSPETSDVEIKMGPNIKALPHLEELPDELLARVVLKTKDNITTDDILPGGARILPLRSNIPEISKHVFSQLDPDFLKRIMAAGNGIIVGGENYGQGSSREHAALAPRYLGIRLVLAKSFARLHRANLINFGIIPGLITNEAYDMLQLEDEISISSLRSIVLNSDKLIVEVQRESLKIPVMLDLTLRERQIVLKGGILNYYKGLLNNMSGVEKV